MQKLKENDASLHSIVNAGLFVLPLLMALNNLFYKYGIMEDVVLASTTVIASLLLAAACLLPYRNPKDVKLRAWISSGIGIFFGIASTLINASGYGSIVQYADFVLLLSLFLVYPLTRVQRRILYCESVLSIVLILVIFPALNEVNRLYYTIIPGWQVDHINPNTVGLLYFFLFVFAVLLLEDIEKLVVRIPLIFASWCGAIYFILLSQSRAALAAALCFGFMVLVAPLFRKKQRIAPWLVAVGLVLTVGITVFYILLYQHTDGEVTLLGKNLFTGREEIWQEIYTILSDHWFFGYNNQYKLWEGRLTSAHNSLLGFWVTLGLLPTLIACERMIAAFEKKPLGHLSRNAALAVFATMILMCVETVLTDSMLYFYFVLLFVRVTDSGTEVAR